MPEYRCYLLGARDDIMARQEFEAEDDDSAKIASYMLFDACSDLASKHEVWEGARCLYSSNEPLRSLPAAFEINAQIQELVIELEERIRSTQSRIAESVRLMRRIDDLSRSNRYKA